MRKTTVELDVWVLDEGDVAHVTDEARVRGTMQKAPVDLSAEIPGCPPVHYGLSNGGGRGPSAWASVYGHKLAPGDGVAVHPALPGGSVAVPAILLLDAPGASAEPERVEDPPAPPPVEKAASPAKKATKKRARKAAS